MSLYVALLRGINVGGKNLIKMTDLQSCFEGLGLTNVRTYIQSGNVIFGAEEPDKSALASWLVENLSKTFQYDASLTLRSKEEMRAIVGKAPAGFGSEPEAFRYDVIFLKEPLTAEEAMRNVSTREGVDQAFAGDGVLYFSRLISRASQSRLTRIISLPVYQSMTIRNWNTTTKLLGMLEEANVRKIA